MHKNRWRALTVLLVCLVFPLPSQPEPREPDGFGGVRWGEDASTVDGLSPKGTTDHLVIYRRMPELTVFGGAAVDKVDYFFSFGKFMGAQVSFRGRVNFTLLKTYLISRYGTGRQRNYYVPRFTWLFPSVLISLTYLPQSDSGALSLCYLPLWNRMDESEEKPLPLYPLP